jgi:hypothetical protein
MPKSKLPTGIQDFETIISEGYTYVDKTELIYQLITRGKPYFLSRPRRFGKSLLVSTLHALFSGRRDLFKGLWIDTSDWTWVEYPIIRLDMSTINNNTPEMLENALIAELNKIAKSHECVLGGVTSSDYLSSLIDQMSEHQKVVVLVDEYDKPILDHLTDGGTAFQNREILRRFYSILKARDADLKFVFLTGVTKFSKVSVFSGLNNLKDISLYKDYSTLLGLTEEEITRYFTDDLTAIAKEMQESLTFIRERMKKWYNGYSFCQAQDTERVYNPLSVMSFLDTGRFNNYWFTTATPTFALNLIKENDYPVADFETGVVIGDTIDESYETDQIDLATLLYQTGYLTIDHYDDSSRRYFLKYPNEEVRRSFTNHLLREMTAMSPSSIEPQMYRLEKAVEKEDFKTFFDEFNILLSSIPYSLQIAKEAYYHSLLYAILRCLNFEVAAEVMTSRGRIDMVFSTKNRFFVFEFKIDSTSSSALKQIKENKYYQQFIQPDRALYLIGANFDSQTRLISDWSIEKG